MSVAKEGILFVVSAPSGAGKHTVRERVLAQSEGIDHSVTATTRAPRPGEVHGRDYFFLDLDTFRQRLEANGFMEWAEVHGNLYGTPREELEAHLRTGRDVMLEIDVQGMRNIKALRPDAVTIFIMAPSYNELERRIRARGANDEASITLRLQNARAEVDARHEYDYIVVNDKLEAATADMLAIVRAERRRAIRQP